MSQTVRTPAVAGMFYPGQDQQLRKDIERYLNAATPPDLQGVKAFVAPHAGYMYSGPVAAFAYKLLAAQKESPKRVFIMGPSHRAWFRGVALPDASAFRTPLGIHPLDVQLVNELRKDDELFITSKQAHAAEHCLEVQIPFLQVVLPDVPMIPMLFGDVDPVAVGDALECVLRQDDLIIVSSDLSHYHPNETAHRLDGQFISALLGQSVEGVTSGEACGQTPALTLLTIAQKRNWTAHLLDYRTSGDVVGDKSQVVGYAAIAYTEGA